MPSNADLHTLRRGSELSRTRGAGRFSLARISSIVCTLGALTAAKSAHAQSHVACVGDSITEGAGASSPDKSYPSVLQNLLGKTFAVQNDGHSGRTLMKEGDYPFWNEVEFTNSTNWVMNGGDVVIQLGTNDSKPWNWSKKDTFLADCEALVNHYLGLSGRPRVWLNLAPPATVGNECCSIDGTVIDKEVLPLLAQCASDTGISTIDVHGALAPHPEYFPDGVHPNDEGAALLAQTVHDALVKLPTVSLESGSAHYIGPAKVSLTATPVAAYGKVEKVLFEEGGATLGEATTAPWTLALDGVGVGSHTYRAVVVETAGRSSESAPVSIVVDPAPDASTFGANTGDGPASDDGASANGGEGSANANAGGCAFLRAKGIGLASSTIALAAVVLMSSLRRRRQPPN